MVANSYFKFREYRDETESLKSSAESVLEAMNSLSDFKVSNKRLMIRAGISQSSANALLDEKTEITRSLKQLIQELNNELKYLNPMINDTTVLHRAHVLSQFQRSIMKHVGVQNGILTKLYKKGLTFFKQVDEQLQIRTHTLEQSHDRFRNRVDQLLDYLTMGNVDKGDLANGWADVLEYLAIYINDELDIGLSVSAQEFISNESHPPSRGILERYYQFATRDKYLVNLHKLGLNRHLLIENDPTMGVGLSRNGKKGTANYHELDEEKQGKIDKEIKTSLLVLLQGIVYQSKSGEFYNWDGYDKKASSDEKKKYLKGIIEELYAKEEEKKITKENVEMLHQLLIEFESKVIISACKRRLRFNEGNLNYHSLRIARSNTNNGKVIVVKDLYDKEFLENNDNKSLVDSLIMSLDDAINAKKPEEHPFVQGIFADGHNQKIYPKIEPDKDPKDDEKLSDSEKQNIRNYWTAFVSNSGFSNGIVQTNYGNYSSQLQTLILALGLNPSDIKKDGEEFKPTDKFKLVLKAFNKEFNDDCKELLKVLLEMGFSESSSSKIIELISKIFNNFS